jgi:hypothetical protein
VTRLRQGYGGRASAARPAVAPYQKNLLAWSRFWLRIAGMGKRGVCVGVIVLGLASTSFAQRSLSLINSTPDFPSLGLSNAQYFFLATGLNWIEPAPNFLPGLPAAQQPTAAAYSDPSKDGKDSSKEAVDLAQKNWIDYVHGEVGFLYGRSAGKFDREVEQGYVIGTVGNDHFSITAGASYENWSGNGRGFKFRP